MKYIYPFLITKPIITTFVVIIPLIIVYNVWQIELEHEYIFGPLGEGPNYDIFTVIKETSDRLLQDAERFAHPSLVRTIPGTILNMDHNCELAAVGIVVSSLIQAGVIDMPFVLGYLEYIYQTLHALSDVVVVQDYPFVERLFNEIVTICRDIEIIIGDRTTITQSPDNYEIFKEIQPLIESLVKKFCSIRICMEHHWDTNNAILNTYDMIWLFIPDTMSMLVSMVSSTRNTVLI